MIDSLIQQLTLQFEALSSQAVSKSYLSLSCPIIKAISLAPSKSTECFYISKPDSGLTWVGLGSLIKLQASGKNRFNTIKENYTTILDSWYTDTAEKTISPKAFIAFSFDEDDPMTGIWGNFPNTILTIPKILIKEQIKDNSIKQTLIINIKIKPEKTPKSDKKYIFNQIINLFSDYLEALKAAKETAKKNYTIIPSKYCSTHNNPWTKLTNSALSSIKKGKFEKLVTSRYCSVSTDKSISLTQLMHNLSTHYPCCTLISYQTENKTIVAASPERLLTLKHNLIQSDAIGGTIPKKREDSSLLNFQANTSENKKLLKEHQFISHDIYQRLNPFCNSLKMPFSPDIMMLHNMYHLESLIQGKLKHQYNIFDMLEVLHPTPAVAGVPAQKAKQWIIQHENYNRGWYCGAFGWVDSNLDGELSVMLRCALIDNNKNKIDLFAGAGLIAESNPQTEWQETETKMQTILDML